MNTFEIPSAGLRLAPHPADKSLASPQPTPVLRLHLLQEKTKEIIDSLRAGKQVHLQTGRQPVLQYGDHKLKLQNAPEPFPSEVYTRPKGHGNMLYFAGKLGHTLEVQQAKQDTAKVDDALATLQSSLKSLKEEKAMNETSFVSSREEMKMLAKDHRASPLLAGRKDLLNPKSIPGSPYQSASRAAPPTSTPMPASSNKDSIRLEAIKIAMIHLLAIRPMTPKEVADRLRAPKEDVDRLLEKHAPTSTPAGKRELRDRSYRVLDVWKFSYPKPEDRQAAIDRAISAFDRMRVDQSDPVWQLLLPSEERGKGKVLSKLRIDSQAPKPKPKPMDKGDVSEAESRVARKGAEKRKAEAGSDTPQKKTKPSATTAGTKKKELKSGRTTTTDSKIKSSEKIEDSDEEAGLVPVVPATNRVASPAKKVQVPPRAAPASPSVLKPTSAAAATATATATAARKQPHKAALSTSSSADNGDGHVPKPTLKQPPSDSAASSKPSQRPRHGSSPQKPSPLGSSPPTNSTDTDCSSSGKAASQSSAPTSPPSSTDMPIAKQKATKYSPVSSDNAPSEPSSRGRPASLKRPPGDENGDDRRPKKQQVNGTRSIAKDDKPSASSVKRPRSDSVRSAASDQAVPTRQAMMDKAKRFQQYYKKYKDAYERLAKQPEEERDTNEVDDVIKKHKRLQEMKSEIWENWSKIENTS